MLSVKLNFAEYFGKFSLIYAGRQRIRWGYISSALRTRCVRMFFGLCGCCSLESLAQRVAPQELIHRRDTLASMKAHRHLRLVWPPPPKRYSRPGRSIAVMGPPGVGKTAIIAALAGELLWRDEHLVLVDATRPSSSALSAWIEAGRPGVFDDVPLLQRDPEAGAHAAVAAVANGGTALVDVPHDVAFDVAASICRTVRLTIYVRRGSNDRDGNNLTAQSLENLTPRHALSVLYNGLTREQSLRALRTDCCRSGIGSLSAALSERVAYRTGRYTGRPPAFQGAGARIARAEISRLADAIDRHFWQIALIDRWQQEQSHT